MYVPMCYVCGQSKHEVGPEGECISKVCVDLRENPSPPVLFFGAVPGGTRGAAVQKAQSQQFDRDMNAYREARRAGETPDQVSEKAVEENRRRQEAFSRVEKVFDGWDSKYDG